MPYTQFTEPLSAEDLEAKLAQLTALPLDENTLDVALNALNDPEDEVVAWALYVFKQMGVDTAVPQLMEFIYQEEDGLVCLALEVLGEIASLEHLPDLQAFQEDASKAVRDSARQAVQRIRERFSNLSADELLERLKHAEDRLKPTLLHLLGALAERRFANQIVPYVYSENPAIMKEAAKTLAKTGDRSAVSHLSKLLRRKNIPDTQKGAIIAALGELGDGNAIAPLMEQLKLLPRKVNQRYGNVFILVTALVRLRAKSAAPIFGTLLERGDEHVQRHVLWGLAELGDAKQANRIRPLMDNEVTRPYAALALGKLGEKVDAIDVLRVMRSKTPEVRQSALEVLKRLGVGQVMKLLNHRDSEIRREAATAIGRLNARDGAEALIKLLNDPQREVQKAAAGALENYPSDNAQTALAAWREQQAFAQDSKPNPAEDTPSTPPTPTTKPDESAQ